MPDDRVARLLTTRKDLSARLRASENESELDRLNDERRALDAEILEHLSTSNHPFSEAELLDITLEVLIPNVKRETPIWRALDRAIRRARPTVTAVAASVVPLHLHLHLNLFHHVFHHIY